MSDYLILKQRAAEEERRRYEIACKTHHTLDANATWEIKTNQAIERRCTERHRTAQQCGSTTEEAGALERRRDQLAQVIAAEQRQYERELDALHETPADRNQRMRERATALRDKRESERLRFVEEQYERQRELACEPLRAHTSRSIRKATDAALAHQICERSRTLEKENLERRAFDNLWEEDRLSKVEREVADRAARKQLDAAQTLVLDAQLRELHATREQQRECVRNESKLLAQQCALERDEVNKLALMRKEETMRAHAESRALNAQQLELRAADAQRERHEDRLRLDAALAAERSASGTHPSHMPHPIFPTYQRIFGLCVFLSRTHPSHMSHPIFPMYHRHCFFRQRGSSRPRR